MKLLNFNEIYELWPKRIRKLIKLVENSLSGIGFLYNLKGAIAHHLQNTKIIPLGCKFSSKLAYLLNSIKGVLVYLKMLNVLIHKKQIFQ